MLALVMMVLLFVGVTAVLNLKALLVIGHDSLDPVATVSFLFASSIGPIAGSTAARWAVVASVANGNDDHHNDDNQNHERNSSYQSGIRESSHSSLLSPKATLILRQDLDAKIFHFVRIEINIYLTVLETVKLHSLIATRKDS